MVKTSRIAAPSAQQAKSHGKYRTLGVPLLPEDYSAFAALATAENRSPGNLGRIIVLAYLNARRPAPAAPAPPAAAPAPEGNSP